MLNSNTDRFCNEEVTGNVRKPTVLSRRVRKIVVVAAALVSLASPAAGASRSAAERLAFVRENPCPVTGLRRGRCPGWEVDHVVALVCGGADKRHNMQWLTVQQHRVKTRSDVRLCRQSRHFQQQQ